MTDKDFTWYFHYHAIHNLGGDIISKDQKRVLFNTTPVMQATQVSVDLILKDKVQPPVGQYDREAGVALFKGGRIAFLHDEPLRLTVFRSEGLPFKWDFVNQVARVNKYVLKGWDGLPTGPKMAQLTSVYGQAIEAAATGSKSVADAMAKAQADGTRILKS